jgi:hypothetical protein
LPVVDDGIAVSTPSHTASGFPTANPAYSYAPQAPGRRQREQRRERRGPLAGLAAAAVPLAAGGVALGILALTHTRPFRSARALAVPGVITRPSGKSGGDSFRIAVPKDWERVPPGEVAPGSGALTALKQTQGLGLIVIRRDGPAAHLTGKFLVALDHGIRSETPDYQAVGWRLVDVGPRDAATKALLFTYLRTQKHEIHSVTVVPAGDHSFVVAAVDAAGTPAVAKEVGAIIRSFTLT